jgi:hypothetical protein
MIALTKDLTLFFRIETRQAFPFTVLLNFPFFNPSSAIDLSLDQH